MNCTEYGSAFLSGYTLLAVIGTFFAAVNVSGNLSIQPSHVATLVHASTFRWFLCHQQNAQDVPVIWSGVKGLDKIFPV